LALFKNIGSLWQRTGLAQRVMLTAILLVCAGAGFVLVEWARKPNMSLLYSSLAPAEASKVVDKIRDAGVSYELKDGGSSIFVPEEKVYELRLTMAQQGLPGTDQGGWSILDNEKIGASPFTQHVNYVRALEGELAKTIKLIEGVSLARVHIVRPEQAVFARGEKEASATVMVRLRAGGRLGGSSVAAIVNLLAGSVEGLTPEKVVVVDSQGNLLSGDSQNEFARGAGTFLDYKTRVEQYLSHKAEDMLTAALGPGRASVQIDVTLDTSSVNQRTEKVDPASKVITHEQTKSSSAVPGGPQPEGSSAGGSKEESSDVTSVVSKTVEERIDLPGKIKTKSIAAFVDLSGEKPADGKTADGKPADAKSAPAVTLTIKDAEEIIRNAIGFNEGDTIKVVPTTFFRNPEATDLKVEEAGFLSKDFVLEMARRSSLAVLVIGALLALKIFGGSKKAPALTASAEQGQLAVQTGGGQGAIASQGDTDPAQLRSRITRALQENPEEVKRLFLSWVESEKEEV
jgi:flagellar M-ring protein FliF